MKRKYIITILAVLALATTCFAEPQPDVVEEQGPTIVDYYDEEPTYVYIHFGWFGVCLAY